MVKRQYFRQVYKQVYATQKNLMDELKYIKCSQIKISDEIMTFMTLLFVKLNLRHFKNSLRPADTLD